MKKKAELRGGHGSKIGLESNRVWNARVLSWKWRVWNEHPRRRRRAAMWMSAWEKKAGIKASWEDAGCRGVEAVEQRDGLTPHSFQGTCSLTLPKDRHSSVKIRTNHRNLILDTQGEWRKSLYMFVCLSLPGSSCLSKSAGGHEVLAVLLRLKIIKTRRQMRTWS